MAKDGNKKKWAIGALLAAGAGYLAGILTAPKSGKETRDDIKETTGKDIAAAEAQLKKTRAELDKAISNAKAEVDKLKGHAKDELSSALAKADSATDKAHEILNAVKAGEADDRDLQEALNNVTEAFDHLKSYLKKS